MFLSEKVFGYEGFAQRPWRRFRKALEKANYELNFWANSILWNVFVWSLWNRNVWVVKVQNLARLSAGFLSLFSLLCSSRDQVVFVVFVSFSDNRFPLKRTSGLSIAVSLVSEEGNWAIIMVIFESPKHLKVYVFPSFWEELWKVKSRVW